MFSSRLVFTLFRYQRAASNPLYVTAIPAYRSVRCYNRPSSRITRQGVNWAGAFSKGPISLYNVWEKETSHALAEAGLDETAAQNLLWEVLIRMDHKPKGWSVDGVYHMFKTFAQWKNNPGSVPLTLGKLHSTSFLARARLHTLSPDRIGETLTILSKQYLRLASCMLDLTLDILPGPLNAAVYLLELAIMYGSVQAATILMNVSEDPLVRFVTQDPELRKMQFISPNTRGARSLLKARVSENPEGCDWQTKVSHIRDEFREGGIGSQQPRQVSRAIDMLHQTAMGLAPDKGPSGYSWLSSSTPMFAETIREPSKKYLSWIECENPWRVLHRVITRCLRRNLSVPLFTTPKLEELREQCLLELVKYNDPNACFTIAIREHEMGTPEWGKLVKCAAFGGIADANWLLSGFYFSNTAAAERLKSDSLPGRLEDDLIEIHGGLALRLDLNKNAANRRSSSSSNEILYRVLALVSYMKLWGGHDEGLEVLADVKDDMQASPSITAQTKHKMQTFLSDYTKNNEQDERWSWHRESCLNRVHDGFNIKRVCHQAKQSEDYWGSLSQRTTVR